MKRGFTLVEMLIVIAIFAAVSVILLALINPWAQLNKANDARRKSDLAIIQKALEDFYNDKGCYPRTDEICYDAGQYVCDSSGNKTAKRMICHICGKIGTPNAIKPYINNLPCDPEYPTRNYLYVPEIPGCTNPSNASCSTTICPANYCSNGFRIYADFSSIGRSKGYDADSANLNCLGGGCGLSKGWVYPTGAGPYGYDYGVTNGSVKIEYSNEFQCVISGYCNGCGGTGSWSECYNNPYCDKNKIFATTTACQQCLSNPSLCN